MGTDPNFPKICTGGCGVPAMPACSAPRRPDGQALEPHGNGYMGHHDHERAERRIESITDHPGAVGDRRPAGSGRARHVKGPLEGKAEKGILARCFHRSRREICRLPSPAVISVPGGHLGAEDWSRECATVRSVSFHTFDCGLLLVLLGLGRMSPR